MKRFRKILCYMGSESDPSPGLESAFELAARNNATLTLIDVLPESRPGPWLASPGLPELDRMVVGSRIEELDAAASKLREDGLQVGVLVTTGSPFVELIRQVVVGRHDLVVKTAQGLDGRLGGLLGTTALHLMRKCPVPVWVVKPSTGEEFGRVLAAVDPQADLSSEDTLNIKILELAGSLAEATRKELHIVHAWWLPAETVLRGRRVSISPAEVDRLLGEIRGDAERRVNALLEQVDLSRVRHQAHIAKGQPYDVVSRFASQSDIAVMGTLSRSGVEGLLIGNTAERVLRRVDCSVLAVKPEDFRTPLRFEEAAGSAGA
jgi:nucleotide-binding universal stress UspA family protein